MKVRSALALVALLCASSGALAQDRPATAVDPKACAPEERVLPGAKSPQAPATNGQNAAGDNLSNKLARTEGVICPENIDPHIKAPTPEAGKMPVIPPPGSPGGDPSVRPK